MNAKRTEALERGFDRGNYGNAYESQDWESWYAENCDKAKSDDYRNGMILGFFSSYEIDEIGDEEIAETVAYLRQTYGMED